MSKVAMRTSIPNVNVPEDDHDKVIGLILLLTRTLNGAYFNLQISGLRSSSSNPSSPKNSDYIYFA